MHNVTLKMKMKMKVLTASRLRRSCSLLRATSLSLSTVDCVVTSCVSLGDFSFCCSASLGASNVACVEMFSGTSFCSALHKAGRLEGHKLCYLEATLF